MKQNATNRAPRDMTRHEFLAALRRRGLEPAGWMGYVECPLSDGSRVSISRLNAGDRYRDGLAYILREIDRHEAEIARKAEG